jgi:DNA modification methylase
MKAITVSRETMPTAMTSNRHPVHKWYNFVAGYSPEYVDYTIESFINRNGYKPERIYDPFAGCGTTNVVANSHSIPSIGVERNPIFYKIGKAKVNALEVLELFPIIAEEFNELIYSYDENPQLVKELTPDASTYLNKLFNENALDLLLLLRNKVLTYIGTKYDAGFIFLNKVIDMVTHSKTDGIYKAPTSTKKSRPVLDSIRMALDEFEGDRLLIYNQQNLSEYIFASSVDYKPTLDSLDLVVFSPPYLNNFDFAEMTRMHMYFWGEAGSWGEISNKHRNNMIINTTTALKNARSPKQQEYYRSTLPTSLLETIDPLVLELNETKKTKPSKKPYDQLIYPYLSQMQEVLKSCYEGLREKGSIHIVVSDAAFYGIHIDTQNFLAEVMVEIGYKCVSIGRMRTRGDRWELKKRKKSGKQLGEYEIIGIKG